MKDDKNIATEFQEHIEYLDSKIEALEGNLPKFKMLYKKIKTQLLTFAIISLVVYLIWGAKWFFWIPAVITAVYVVLFIWYRYLFKKIDNIKIPSILNEDFEDLDDKEDYTQEVIEQCNEIISKLQPYKKEYIKLKPIYKKAKDIFSSKFAGEPYWPKGLEYPTNNKGEKLYLLAQLNFKELPHLEGYPESGILQFFIADDDLWGLDFDKSLKEKLKNPDGYRVVYHENIVEDKNLLETNLPSIGKNNNMPLDIEYALKATKKSELPSLHDCAFEQIIGDIYEKDYYSDDLLDLLSEKISNDGSKIGGYAVFAQEDPRYGNDCKEWQLLFQMDTHTLEDDGVEIMWGDSGVANFFIEPKALEKRDFSRVWYNWDCY